MIHEAVIAFSAFVCGFCVSAAISDRIHNDITNWWLITGAVANAACVVWNILSGGRT